MSQEPELAGQKVELIPSSQRFAKVHHGAEGAGK